MKPQLAVLMQNGSVRFVYKDFVLKQHQPSAQWAAEAALCAADQNQFWRYHDYLYEHQERWSREGLKSYASKLGLDTAKFSQCLDSAQHASDVNTSTDEALSLDLPGTPTFLLNGKLVDLKQLGHLDDLVKQELRER